MKIISFSLSLLILKFLTSIDFYTIQFENVGGTIINTSSFQGKKVVIAVVSGNTAGSDMVAYLDSVQGANANVRAIAVTTGDFGGSITTQALQNLSENATTIVTKPMLVKKSHGDQQHLLFKWITRVAENSHFDKDVEGEGQIFIVSGNGTLYSVLPQNTPKSIVNRVINQPFTQ